MKYQRVIPRDFFNESKLLKCFGQLSLSILDRKTPAGIDIYISEHGQPFEIILMEEGSLTIDNYYTNINDHAVLFKTTYNSKRNYPFVCEYKNEEHDVFDEEGNFTEEFINFCKTLK